MKKNEFKTTITEVVSKKTYNDEIIQTRKVLDCIPRMFDAIDVDRDAYKNKVEDLISRSGNSLNSILKIFGIRMISGKKLEWEYDKEIEPIIDIIKLDVNLFTYELEALIKLLSKLEKTYTKEIEERQKSLKELLRLNEKLKDEITQIKKRETIKENQLLQSLQDIITLEYSKNGENSEVYEELVRMLKDLSVDIYWPHENNPSTSDFQVLNISRERRNMCSKPCFKRGDEVLLQGLVFKMISSEAVNEKD